MYLSYGPPHQAHNYFCTWSGYLPPRFCSRNPRFSCKLFLGGLPRRTTELQLIEGFSQFGDVGVKWPVNKQGVQEPGYAHIMMWSEQAVRALLNYCEYTKTNRNSKRWYYRLFLSNSYFKVVEVIPWDMQDNHFGYALSEQIYPDFAVFIGAVHGLITAEGLFIIMDDLFGGVVYVDMDTDRFKYPIGSARVYFCNRQSFLNAVRTGFVLVKNPKFSRTLQIEPYLKESVCSGCEVRWAAFFCRNQTCFRYFCQECWALFHQNIYWHKQLVCPKSRWTGLLCHYTM